VKLDHPVGKEGIPGVGGSLSCEKSKREAKAMDRLGRLLSSRFFFQAAQGDSDSVKGKEKANVFVSDLNGRVRTSSGRCNEWLKRSGN